MGAVPAVHAPAWSRRRGIDALIVVAVLAGVLEVGLRSDATEPSTSLWFALPAVAVIGLVLLGWRSFGFAAGTALWLLAAGISTVDGRLLVSAVSVELLGMGAAYLLGNCRDARQAYAGLAIVVVCAAVVVSNDPQHRSSQFVVIPALFAVAWVAGFALRQRTAQTEAARERALRLEAEQEEQALRAIADERARIARELHDVVGHCVSVMTVQTSAVRRVLTPEQSAEREALLSVERVGREALAEMRRLVGILRTAPESPALAPQPSLTDLNDLIDHAHASGLDVTVVVEGQPQGLPASIDLTGYRIVQEALTNTIRHAHATQARIRIAYSARALDLEVRDNGTAPPSSNGSGGHGLLGMKERVEVFGGAFAAGPDARGGYRLWAQLPVAP